MKELEDLTLPEDVRYAPDHEWAAMTGDKAKIGVSDYAQDQLGDIVFVEMPQTGDIFAKGEVFGTLESVKAVSELYMPIGGKIVSVNAILSTEPERINQDPYANWIIEIRPSDSTEYDDLLSVQAYREMLEA